MPSSAPPSRRVLTDRGRVLLSAGATVAAGGMLLGYPDLIRVGVFVLALPLVALLAGRRGLPDLVATRRTDPEEVTTGRPATLTLRIENAGRRRTPLLMAEEHLGYALGERRRFVLPAIAAGDALEVPYPIHPMRRGLHQAGPLTVHRRDPFGLCAQVTVVPGRADLVALPSVHPIWGVPEGGGTGVEGDAATMVPLQGGDDSSIRAYQLGDDLRRIHWPVTAHRGALMMRQDGRPSLRRAVLLLDTLVPDGDSATGHPDVDRAVELLASVATHLAGQGFVLHLAVPQREGAAHTEIPLGAGDTVRALALADPVTPDDDPAVRGAFLAGARDLALAGGLVVAVTTTYDENAVHDLLGTRTGASVGILFLVDHPGHRAGPADPRADDLAALARSGGWHAVVVRRGDTIPAVWEAARIGRGVHA